MKPGEEAGGRKHTPTAPKTPPIPLGVIVSPPMTSLTSSCPSSVQAWSLKCLMLMAVMTWPFRRESQEQWGKMISL